VFGLTKVTRIAAVSARSPRCNNIAVCMNQRGAPDECSHE